ncbi:oxidoreductase [Mucilaginibacter sp. SMC90]|uniref:oxidoreductase n=1 Tax=Mucilaginibacter sp. SMC90 TaxID=2929803 RepID=UPI001FB1BA47|nr:oxidoreductase [Mucilaginibacter sp. SMC90]UOE47461.1 oxidoreductase [Mucilaginibacter sp. SMC90]
MWTSKNIADQSGKIVIITGANSGIGFEMAKTFYNAGAEVIVASRDEEKAKSAIIEIERSKLVNSGKLGFIPIDLSSLDSVRSFTEAFMSSYDHLDVLINNAGVMVPPQTKTKDGFELQFGVNYLANFALTVRLYPMLVKSDSARVVTLSSGAHKYATDVDFDNLRLEKGYDAFREYAISKLADLQFVIELQRRIDKQGDKVISVGAHPGVTNTALARNMDKISYEAALAKFGELMPAWQGALPALYAATFADVIPGGYYGPDGTDELKGYPAAAFISPQASDPVKGGALWAFSEQAAKVVL